MTATAWFDEFRLNGYYFKPAIIGTLLTGIYLHLSVLFLGHALVVRYIATPALDMLLAIPITYGAIMSWILRPRCLVPRAGPASCTKCWPSILRSASPSMCAPT